MTSIDLSGKIAIVTGGGRGLGRAMTLALVEAGAKVAAVMHIEDDMAPLEAACADLAGEVRPVLSDIRKPEDCARAVAETAEHFGPPHVLVNNAGVGLLLISETYNTVPAKFWEGSPAAWQQIIDTNFIGAFQMAREAVPHMLAHGWGRIVNVTTSLTTMQRRGYSPYGSSKAALEAATSSWAGDLEGTGVTANVLVPGGAADTHLLPGEPGTPGRMGADRQLIDPAVMQAPVIWLASEHSDGVTGRRFIGKDWNIDLPPDRAGENPSAPAGLGPRPEDFTP